MIEQAAPMPGVGGGGMPGGMDSGMGAPGPPGGMPGAGGMPPTMPGGGMGMGGGAPGGMDPMGGMGPGMGGAPPPAPQQPAAITAKPKDVWQAIAELVVKSGPTQSPQIQQQPQKPKPQLTFMKGVPGF